MVGFTIPLDEVLSKIGLGWFHVRLWWISGFGFSAAAAEVVLMSFVFPELRDGPWNLNEYELGSLATIVSCGSIFGETMFGYLADKYGRRTIFMVTVIIVVTFGILSAFSPNRHWLAVLRLCVGFGYGGNIAVDFTMYSEFLPTEGRGNMLFLLTLFWPLGQLFTCLCAWLVIPRYGWQVFVAACTIPSMITALARPFIPESPRWLATQGRIQDATAVCREMALQNGKSLAEVGLDEGCEVCLGNEESGLTAALGSDSESAKGNIQELFSRRLWRTTLGLFIIVGALNYCGYGTLTLMPSFLEMKGIPKGNMYFTMTMNAAAQFPGVLLASCCGVRTGRLYPMRAAMFIVGIALFSFTLVHSSGAVLACTMFASCFLEAGWAMYHVYVPEVYPTEMRAFATGVLSAGGSIIAMAAPLVSAGFLEAQTPYKAIFVFAAAAFLAGASAFVLLHVETKDRDLEDIHVSQRQTVKGM